MKILIDNRELTLIKLIKALNTDYEYNIEIEVKKMDLGDVAIYNDKNEELILFERKQLTDLAASICDGRYKEQSYRLNGTQLHNHNIVYLIEGQLRFYHGRYSKIKASTLLTTMFSLQYYKGFSVFRTTDITETAEYILRITDKLRREPNKNGYYHADFNEKQQTYTSVVKKVKKDNITPSNISSIILSQIPGISSTLSEVIINKFGSLHLLLRSLERNKSCLNNITYKTSSGNERRIPKNAVDNIIKYLLYQENNVIKIQTEEKQ